MGKMQAKWSRDFPLLHANLHLSTSRESPMIQRLFRDHPASVNETYLEHMGVAGSFGWSLLKASCACFVHALVPGLCECTGSRIITQLHGRMVTNRIRTAEAAEDDALIWIAANI
jgi:hypothetical protein